MKIVGGTRHVSRLAVWALTVTMVTTVSWSCGGGGHHKKKAPVPSILNINGSSDPASPVDVAIEINGSGFGARPGRVDFTDTLDPSNVAVVVPVSSGWSNTGVVAVVPSAGSVGPFPIPGTVTVTVVTGGGTSNGVDLDLVDTPTFSPSNLTWTQTTPLPMPMRGLAASPVRVDDANAYVVLAGGNDGLSNLSAVYTNTLAPDGTLGPAWTTEPNSLPAPRAYHALVEANPQNAGLLDPDDRFVYVIGGQADAADTPGGTDTVYMARVSVLDGSVGSWSQTAALPRRLVGPAAVLYNGFVYIVSGLQTDGTPSEAVYKARVQSDGALEPWVRASNDYPTPVSFARVFGFGASLYVVSGDPDTSLDPHEQGRLGGTKDVYLASAQNGTIGSWTATARAIKQRKKHIVWAAFGQIVAAEGIYNGGIGGSEAERSAVLPDGSLSPWNGLTGAAIIAANVYNAAAFVSPIRVPLGAPRFLLLGGQVFTATPPGGLSSAVYFNDGP
ncbi:MAG: hypothetical protein O7H41_15245 [Planctomycetota bacterium]|nr:hypothetical protein [Planctomycetota bacterium]